MRNIYAVLYTGNMVINWIFLLSVFKSAGRHLYFITWICIRYVWGPWKRNRYYLLQNTSRILTSGICYLFSGVAGY